MRQTDTKGIQDLAQLGWKSDSLKDVQKTHIWPRKQMSHTKLCIFSPGNETNEMLWDIEIQKDQPIIAQRPGLVLNIKKRTCGIPFLWTIEWK